MKSHISLFLRLLLFLFATSSATAQDAIAPGDIGYRFLAMTPTWSSDFPGGYAFGREVMGENNRSIRWLGSLSMTLGGSSLDATNENTSETDTDQFEYFLDVNLTRQWIRYGEKHGAFVPAFGFGPSIGLVYQNSSSESTREQADTNLVNLKTKSERSLYELGAGIYATLEINWQIHPRVHLIGAWGVRAGVAYSGVTESDDYTYPLAPTSDYKSEETTTNWELFARTQAVTLGLVFWL